MPSNKPRSTSDRKSTRLNSSHQLDALPIYEKARRREPRPGAGLVEHPAQGNPRHHQARCPRTNRAPLRPQPARGRVVAAAVDAAATLGVKFVAFQTPGGVAEWSNAHAWKACGVERLSRVRISTTTAPFSQGEKCSVQ